ncbi:MAG: GAF domain-containing protein [Deltaproteobacteria bacterium]|nr:GAF domain-containing protein [Deltaproteobacteria bacterium]
MEKKDYQRQVDLLNIELDIYRQIGGIAVKALSTETILSQLMDFSLKAVQCSSGTIYIFDEKKKDLTFKIIKGPLARKLKGRKMYADQGIVGLVATLKKPYVSNDLSKDKNWLPIGGTQKNVMAVPLIIKNRTIGVMQVFDKKGGKPFKNEDLKMLSSIANHFAMIMQSASVFNDLQNRIRQSATLQEVGSLLISSLDPKIVRHRAMEAITKLMRAQTGSLLMVDEKTHELFFEVALGEAGAAVKEIRLKMGEGIAGWVAVSGKPLIVPDVLKDRRFQGKVDKKSKFRTRNMICVPVVIKGKVIGVLQAINRLGGLDFTRDDLRLFQLFSNQVAIALDNARLYQEIKETFYATSEALAEAIEKRDPYTGGHTKRVLEYSMAIVKFMEGVTPEFAELLRLSAVLHDIGKIGVADSILRKQAPLDNDEAEAMRQHPLYGVQILKHVPQLKDIIPGMLYHHEKPDGRGYPEGLLDGQIPLVAKIISVADTYDAMTTTRPYRKGLPAEVAIGELKKFSGTQFDGAVVDAFLKAFEAGTVQGIVTHTGADINILSPAAQPENRQPEDKPEERGA